MNTSKKIFLRWCPDEMLAMHREITKGDKWGTPVQQTPVRMHDSYSFSLAYVLSETINDDRVLAIGHVTEGYAYHGGGWHFKGEFTVLRAYAVEPTIMQMLRSVLDRVPDDEEAAVHRKAKNMQVIVEKLLADRAKAGDATAAQKSALWDTEAFYRAASWAPGAEEGWEGMTEEERGKWTADYQEAHTKWDVKMPEDVEVAE